MNLTEAIEKQDVEMIRRRLATYVVANPHDEKRVVQQALAGLNQKQVNIWDATDSFVRKERSDWTKEYLADAYASLKTEAFSKGLFNHVIEVGKNLSPIPKATSSQKNGSKSSPVQSRIERLSIELTELDSILRKKGLNEKEMHRFNEIRRELKRLESQSKRYPNQNPDHSLLIKLIEIAKQIFNSLRGR